MKFLAYTIAAMLIAATSATACNTDAARRCQQQYWDTINKICPWSQDPGRCREGALNRYDSCKYTAGCR